MKPARMQSSCERGTGWIENGEGPRSPWRTIYVAMETHAIALRKLVPKSRVLPRQHKKTTNTWPLYFLKDTACTEGPNGIVAWPEHDRQTTPLPRPKACFHGRLVFRKEPRGRYIQKPSAKCDRLSMVCYLGLIKSNK